MGSRAGRIVTPPLNVSNPDRVVFPDVGLTKGDVVRYYTTAAARMLPHLSGSPLTLERFPKGLSGGGFMQKNAGKHFPETIGRHEVPRRGGTTVYPVVYEAADIAYLANQGTLTFHAWTSRVSNPSHPVRLVIDLDPPTDSADSAREAAELVGEALRNLGLPSAPVATGSKGYHVVAPIAATTPYSDVATMAQGLAALLCTERSDLLTTEFRKVNRKGRVFVDWLRNAPGSTTVVPWSLRPRPHAPTAVPIGWADMDDTPPDRWSLNTVDERLGSPDPLAALMVDAPDATGAVAAVAGLLAEREIELEPFDRFRS